MAFFFSSLADSTLQDTVRRPAAGQRDAFLPPTIVADTATQLGFSFACKQRVTLSTKEVQSITDRGMDCISFQINDPNIDIKMNSFLCSIIISWYNNHIYVAFLFYLCFYFSYLLNFLSHCIIFLGFKSMSDKEMDKGRRMPEAQFALLCLNFCKRNWSSWAGARVSVGQLEGARKGSACSFTWLEKKVPSS